MKKLKKLLLSFLGIFSLIPGKIFGESMSLVYGSPQSPKKTLYSSAIPKIILIFIIPFISLLGLVVYIVSKVKAKKPVSLIVVAVLSIISTLLIIAAIGAYFFYM